MFHINAKSDTNVQIPNSAKGIIILKGINTGYTPTQDKTGKDD